MRFITLALGFWVPSCLTSIAHGGRPASDHVVHEKRNALVGGWTMVDRADPELALSMRIGLKQSNLDRASEFMHSVAHPDSTTYGQYWTAQRVVEMFAPSREAVSETISWLVDAGIPRNSITRTASLSWIRVNLTVEEAEGLLHTSYNVYENEDGLRLVACDSYSVPAAIQKHIDLITPTITLDPWGMTVHQRTKRDAITPNAKFLPWRPKPQLESLANCSQTTTPACLRALYNIPEAKDAVEGNSYGILEFAPNSFNQTDLDGFFSAFSNLPNGTAPIVDKIDGGYMSSDPGKEIRGESNLDLCYAMSLVYPQNVTLYQVGDILRGASNNNFLDAIDGSYCTFEGGDDHAWDAIYPHDSSTAGAYTGQPMCGTYNATNVISVSYGRIENSHPASYNTRECTEYLKLGLMGITVLFAAGDTGVAALNRCLTDGDGWSPVGGPSIGRFNPMFPASCPWITSIGGTGLPRNGTVHDKELVAYDFNTGGGFSNHFELPDYQAQAMSTYYKYHDPGYNSSIYNNTQKARGFPDLALNAQNYITGLDGGLELFYGTSAATPTFGSMVTLINGERIKAGKGPVGFLNPVLYAHPEIFNDVTNGNNNGCGTDGFEAVEGWDPASGLGTPDYLRLRDVLLELP